MEINGNSQIISKMDAWEALLPRIRELAGETETPDSLNEFVSDKILELINLAMKFVKEDETMLCTTMRLEHRTGLEVCFRLEIDLPTMADEDGK